MKTTIQLRIVLIEPPANVDFAVQRGKAGLLNAVAQSATTMTFEFAVTVADTNAEPLRLLGEFVQGPPTGRFVYINSGTSANQPGSTWTRRAKVPLTAITRNLVLALLEHPGSVLEACIAGTAKDGGPACASVRLLSGWDVTT